VVSAQTLNTHLRQPPSTNIAFRGGEFDLEHRDPFGSEVSIVGVFGSCAEIYGRPLTLCTDCLDLGWYIEAR